MRILLIGATGTVGTELVAELVDKGVAVRALTRDAARADKLGEKVEVVVGDLDDPTTLVRAMHGVERVFLITTGTRQDENALAAARQTGVRHIVKISTQEAGWTPVEGHGHWHKEREDLIRASGLAWTFLRPSMYMSHALSWADGIRSDNVVHSAGSNGKLGPVDPRDVAAVAAVALTAPGHENQAYELTGPELLATADMTAVLAEVTGRPIRHVGLSDAEQGAAFAKMGLPEYAVSGLVETFSLIRGGRFAYLTHDVEKVTGVRPRTFEIWAREHAASFA